MSVDPSPPHFIVKLAPVLVSGLLVLMSVQFAGAQMVSVLNFSSEPTPKPDWIVTLGLDASYGPTYSGASGTGFSFGPSDFSIRRPDEPAGFSAPDDGFDITLFDYDGLSVGPVANYRSGRSGSDDGKLVGLYDISPTVDIGAFAEYWVLDNRLRLRIEMRQALRAREGLLATLSADWVEQFGSFTASVGPRLAVGNASYMQSYYGVTDNEAAHSRYVTEFSPTAGIEAVGATAALSYAFSPSWTGTVYDTYQRLVGDAADSPIVSAIGNRNQNTVGVELSYSFGVKL